jgi:hypothetical protein
VGVIGVIGVRGELMLLVPCATNAVAAEQSTEESPGTKGT